MPPRAENELEKLRRRVAELEGKRADGYGRDGQAQLPAEIRAEDILDDLAEAVVVVDHEWRVLYANREVERRHGMTAEALVGKSFWEKWPDAQGTEAQEQLRHAMKAGVAAEFEQQRGEGEGVWLDVHAFPCEAGLALHFRDITDRKNAEAARGPLAAIIESSNDAIIGKDLNGTIRSWNRGAERIFGYKAEEIIGQHISTLAVPERPDEIPNIMERLRRGERVDHYRTKRRTKDGRIIALSLTVSPIKDSSGIVIGASKVARDISESERTQEALRAANEALNRANADLEQFSYAAAHDLQEPLRMVTIYSQMLKKRYAGRLDEQADEFIKYCVEGARRMEMLVRDLLAYTRATSLYDEPRPLVNLNEVVAEAVGNLQMALAESGASVVYEGLPEVSAHAALMQQLLQNLLSNAIKYRSKEAPVVTVAANRRESEWLVSVSDNGIGIAPQYREQIFGLFKRLHTANEYPGTGLGLAICQRIVERYGGKIWVESEHGQGSTFFFTLPD